MFSKSLLTAFLYLSVATSVLARPTNDFHFGGGFQQGQGNKGSSNTEQCATAVSTVTVTAAATTAAAAAATSSAAAATLANTGKGSKGGNNSNKGGAAGNNNKGGNTGKGGNNAGNGSAAGNNAGSTSTAAASAASSTSSASSSGNNSNDPQSSLTLDPRVLATGFENDGQDQPEAGQVASLTSSNNFINFCLTVPNLPITNGKQITTGSCNPAPMGVIAASTNIPSAKFQNPKNFDTIKANTPFTISMAISHLETGHFVNAQENYFSAPQQVNAAGDIQGHSHVVIEAIDSLTQSTPTDPTRFAFFKGLNAAAQNGVLTADVTAGLPAGTYRLASINTAANHQPALVAIAQHGSTDDMIYFTVTDDGAPAANSTTGGAGAAASSAASGAASASATAGSKGSATKGKGGFGGFKGGKQ